MSYRCWNCGAALEGIIFPLSRRETCPDCASDIHVCRMCRHFDRSAPESCREHERTEPPADKTRANFCDYIELSAEAYREPEDAARARAKLEALFGGPEAEPEDSPRNPLDDLFK